MCPDVARVASASGEPLAAMVDAMEIHLQPVITLATGAVWAFEALARFGGASDSAAGEALDTARRDGYGPELEAACLDAALARRDELPGGARLALNVSPEALLSPAVGDIWHTD